MNTIFFSSARLQLPKVRWRNLQLQPSTEYFIHDRDPILRLTELAHWSFLIRQILQGIGSNNWTIATQCYTVTLLETPAQLSLALTILVSPPVWCHSLLLW